MPLDDLRAALGDLAARVDPVDGDTLPAVRERGRARRRRRTGLITTATTVALLVVLIAAPLGALAGRRVGSAADRTISLVTLIGTGTAGRRLVRRLLTGGAGPPPAAS